MKTFYIFQRWETTKEKKSSRGRGNWKFWWRGRQVAVSVRRSGLVHLRKWCLDRRCRPGSQLCGSEERALQARDRWCERTKVSAPWRRGGTAGGQHGQREPRRGRAHEVRAAEARQRQAGSRVLGESEKKNEFFIHILKGTLTSMVR